MNDMNGLLIERPKPRFNASRRQKKRELTKISVTEIGVEKLVLLEKIFYVKLD